MLIPFSKYHGAGNDFVLIDNRSGAFFPLSKQDIARLCDRHFGIGADGLMLLENAHGNGDFFMRYFNSDGGESTMCGNGGRCITAFAKRIMGAKQSYIFAAIDGQHAADVLADNGRESRIRLQMVDVKKIEKYGNDYFLNTGSPHVVRFVDDVDSVDIIPEARAIRYSEPLAAAGGVNINFVQRVPDGLRIRTYERGVEDETLACGTGATAAAIATLFDEKNRIEGLQYHCNVYVRGGLLTVDFCYRNAIFTSIFLTGPAAFVFEGVFEL